MVGLMIGCCAERIVIVKGLDRELTRWLARWLRIGPTRNIDSRADLKDAIRAS